MISIIMYKQSVLKVVSGDERCVINKTHVELRSNYFDSDSGKWKEHNHICKNSFLS